MPRKERHTAAGEAVDTDRLVSVAAELGGRSTYAHGDLVEDAKFQDFVKALRNWIVDHYELPGSRLERVEKTHLLLHLMVGAPTLREALGLLERFRALVWGDRGIRVLRDGEMAILQFEQAVRQGPPGLLSDLWSLSFLLTELEFLVGGALEGVSGRVRQSACLPDNTVRLLFGRPFSYGANVLALVLPSRQLLRPIIAQASQINHFLEGLVPRSIAGEKRSDPLADLVAGLVQAETRQGAGPPAKLDEVAQRLGLSVATLRRRLSHNGSSFRDIRERVLDELAGEFLRNDLSVEATAERLGYSDAFAFRRAFHRRRGCSPSAFRSGEGRKGRSAP